MKRDGADDLLKEKVLSAEEESIIDTEFLWNKLEPLIPVKQKRTIKFYYKGIAAVLIIAAGLLVIRYTSIKEGNNYIAKYTNADITSKAIQNTINELHEPDDTTTKTIDKNKEITQRIAQISPSPSLAEDEMFTQDPSTFGLYTSVEDEQDDDLDNEQLNNN